MPGWEELSPDQLMTITWVIFSIVVLWFSASIFKSIVNFFISKHIQVQIEKSVESSLQKTPLQKIISNWSKKRKLKKEDKDRLSGYDPVIEKLVK